MATISSGRALPALFDQYVLDEAHDEMFDACGAVRPHYAHLFDALLCLPADELKRRQQLADALTRPSRC